MIPQQVDTINGIRIEYPVGYTNVTQYTETCVLNMKLAIGLNKKSIFLTYKNKVETVLIPAGLLSDKYFDMYKKAMTTAENLGWHLND